MPEHASIEYRAVGEGPPIVLVHGLAGSSKWWRKNVQPLARLFRVYAVDLIGFGRSRSADRFVLGEAAARLADLLDELGLDRASVVGHSMGGIVAAELGAQFPRRVDRLVLVDAPLLPLEQRYGRAVFRLAWAIARLPLDFLPVLLSDALRAGPLTLLQAIRETMSADLGDVLPRIQAPVLLVWGERDVLVPVERDPRLDDLLPGARTVVIPGAGHNPMWDRPEAFNRVVADFLSVRT